MTKESTSLETPTPSQTRGAGQDSFLTCRHQEGVLNPEDKMGSSVQHLGSWCPGPVPIQLSSPRARLLSALSPRTPTLLGHLVLSPPLAPTPIHAPPLSPVPLQTSKEFLLHLSRQSPGYSKNVAGASLTAAGGPGPRCLHRAGSKVAPLLGH